MTERRIIGFSSDDIPISRREALRYMGISGEISEDLVSSLDKNEALLRRGISARCVYTRLALGATASGVRLGDTELESRSLAKALADCGNAYVFAATLGADVDRSIRRASAVSSADGVVLDALASAAIEGVCNMLCKHLGDGLVLCPRFSPGYGDLPLGTQSSLLSLLDAQRSIGLCLTASLMMTPSKSVTAIVGIKNKDQK